jgi:four helix bundle protein
MKTSTTIRDFTSLDAWKFARELRSSIYNATRALPPAEKYVPTNHLRRAAISITANAAEGYGRFSYRENVQFCRQARGSAYEVRDHLTTALDQGYLSEALWKEVDMKAQRVIQILNGYIRSTTSLAKQDDAEAR